MRDLPPNYGWTPPLSDEEKLEIVDLYTQKHLSMDRIAPLFGKSKSTISKVLKAVGVDTSKSVGCWVELTCYWCESPIRRTRSQYHAGHVHWFCDSDCYYDFVRRSGVYIESSPGQRLGRATVEYYYGPLPPDSIVHHEDKSCYNNHPSNLILFANQRDHIRWHRGLRDLVTPLWIGCIHWIDKPYPPPKA